MLQLSSPYVLKQDMFAAAAATGASEIRVDIALGQLNNPDTSAAMWRAVDDYVGLSQQYGIRVLADLSGSNDLRLETCQPGVDPRAGLCGVTNLAGYYDEVAALVENVRGTIDDFEIVNEPDMRQAFTGTPQQYAAMLATAYQAVHDNDPSGRVLLGGIGSIDVRAGLRACSPLPDTTPHTSSTLQTSTCVPRSTRWLRRCSPGGCSSAPSATSTCLCG
jgi:hypothetical protein